MKEDNGEQRVPGYCALCTSRCGSVSTVEGGRLVKIEPNPEHPTGQGLCSKGRAGPELVNHAQRLLHPMRRTRAKTDSNPGWERISWDEALETIATEVQLLASSNGPETIAFGITTPSGTGLQDAYPWIERLRNAFQSPNAVFGTEICNFHRDDVHALSFGVSTPMPDFENTDCIVLWGHNPSATWLSFATRAAQAKMRGAKLVVIDPRREGLSNKADLWLRVRPGSDGALALGVANILIQEGKYDARFLRQWSNAPFLVRESDGCLLTAEHLLQSAEPNQRVAWDEASEKPVIFDPASRHYAGDHETLALTGRHEVTTRDGAVVVCRPVFECYAEICRDYSLEKVEDLTWIPGGQVQELATLIGDSQAYSCFTWSGLGQHTNASQASRAIHLISALTGTFDAPGGNVVLDTVEVADVFGRDLLTPDQAKKALGLSKHPLGPQAQGWVTSDDLYEAILEGRPYPVEGMISFGTNILLSHADSARGLAALQALKFAVHVDMFMTPSASLADIVLPVNTPWEREALCTDFQVGQDAASYVQLRPAAVESRGESKSDLWIAFQLAKRLGLSDKFWDGEIDEAYRALLAPSGLDLDSLRAQPGGISVSRKTRYFKHAEIVDGVPRGFATESSRVEIYSEALQRIGQAPLPDYEEPAMSPKSRPDLLPEFPLVLTSAKSLHYCHSQHRGLPAQRKREPDPVIEIHPETAAKRQIVDGDWICLVTPHGQMQAKARFKESIDPRVVSATAGWWQDCAALGLPGFAPTQASGANVNATIGNESVDPISGSVPHRSYLCDIRRLPAS